MTDNTCNGWTNWETWNIRLQYEELFQEISEENHYRSVDELAKSFEQTVSEIEMECAKEVSMFVTSVTADALSKVNWIEIAESFVD